MARKKTTVGTLPHEIMMEQWRAEAGKVHREELSMKALKLDHRLQAREKHLDLDWVKQLHASVKDGAVFPPIVVFRIDGTNFVANGFHRHEVRKREGADSITADVVAGTWQEAVEYATCCNMPNGALKMKMEDKRKACFMLFNNGWLEKSMEYIASHTGASGSTVARWRAEYCKQTGAEIPKQVPRTDGRMTASVRVSGSPRTLHYRKRGGSMAAEVSATLGGRQISARGDDAEAKVLAKIGAYESAVKVIHSTPSLKEWLSRRGVIFTPSATGFTRYIRGGVCQDRFAVTPMAEQPIGGDVIPNIVSAIGRACVLGEHYGLLSRVVLTAIPLNGCHEDLVDIARRLGVEFMTLEQFVEAVKADEGDGGQHNEAS